MSDERNYQSSSMAYEDEAMDIDGDLQLDTGESFENDETSTVVLLQEPVADDEDDDDDDDEDYMPGSDPEDVDESDDEEFYKEEATIEDIIEGAEKLTIPSYRVEPMPPKIRDDSGSEDEEAEFTDGEGEESGPEDDEMDGGSPAKSQLGVKFIPTSFLLQTPADESFDDDDDEEYNPGN